MDGIPEGEGEGETMEWELLHNNNNDDDDDGGPVNELAPPLESCALIRPDYFSIHPPTPLNSNSSSSSSSTEVDRNFDDSYLANHLFPYLHSHQHQQSSSSAASSHNLPLSHDYDSDSDSKAPIVLQTTTEDLLLDTQAAAAAAGDALNSKEEEEGENREMEEEGVVKEEERSTVWWKVPLEVFKYWVVRVSPVPVWSLSVAAAAAFLGLVILGRRLYKMKRKTQTLKLNVALDDKKVSQLMGRVARLNEAFSVVRRVPIVRPSLPAPPSVTLRPVMSIR